MDTENSCVDERVRYICTVSRAVDLFNELESALRDESLSSFVSDNLDDKLIDLKAELGKLCIANDYQSRVNILESVKITSMNFPIKTERALRRNGIKTLNDLLNIPYKELSLLRGVGHTALTDIEVALERYGVELRR